ncbi:MAG: Fur family transcriptional regulator [Planctomycetota bacterium]|jgi:Fur family ferric uptake transcriptional regulator
MKSEVKRKIESLLASANLRRTSPRIAVLSVLLTARKPQTAGQIAADLAPAGPNKVTIYRTLESFLASGLVHKVFLQERTWHFELARNCSESQCHPHFTCVSCGDMHCLMEISLPMAKSAPKGFVIGRQRVQLEGLCRKCNPNL